MKPVRSILSERKAQDAGQDPEVLVERANEIHSETLVIDGHVGSLFDVVRGLRELHDGASWGHVDLPRLNEARVSCVFMTAFCWDRTWPIRGVRAGLEYADAFSRLGETSSFRVVRTAQDVERAHRDGQVAIALAFEGGELLDASLASLRMFHKLGLRMLALTWDERNPLADGSAESLTRGGLTAFGFDVLSECRKLGIIVDVSHLSEAGFWDVAEHSEVPFVASHSNCHSIYPHPRNLTDDQLRAIARSGGVVGISLNPVYLSRDEAPTASTVADHVIHAIEVAGEEHVGLGSDFDSFCGDGPEPVRDISRLTLLTAELLKRGLTAKTLSLFLGQNWLRVMRAVLG